MLGPLGDDSPMSQATSVAIIIVATVAMAGIAAFFVVDAVGQEVGQPQVTFEYQYDRAQTDNGKPKHVLTIRHGGGAVLSADQVDVVVDGAVTDEHADLEARYDLGEDLGALSEMGAGLQVTLGVEAHNENAGSDGREQIRYLDLSDATVRIVWTEAGKSRSVVLDRWSAGNG